MSWPTEAFWLEALKILGSLATLALTAYIALKSKKADTQNVVIQDQNVEIKGQNEEIHKAVNSTATAMAEALRTAQAENIVLASKVAQLVEKAEGKQFIQAIKDASARSDNA